MSQDDKIVPTEAGVLAAEYQTCYAAAKKCLELLAEAGQPLVEKWQRAVEKQPMMLTWPDDVAQSVVLPIGLWRQLVSRLRTIERLKP